jgi:hypothetical protein
LGYKSRTWDALAARSGRAESRWPRSELKTGAREGSGIGRSHPPRPRPGDGHPIPGALPGGTNPNRIEAKSVRCLPRRPRPALRVEGTLITVDVHPAVDRRSVEGGPAAKRFAPGSAADGRGTQSRGLSPPAGEPKVERVTWRRPALQGPEGAGRCASQHSLERDSHCRRREGDVSSCQAPANDPAFGSDQPAVPDALGRPAHFGNTLGVDPKSGGLTSDADANRGFRAACCREGANHERENQRGEPGRTKPTIAGRLDPPRLRPVGAPQRARGRRRSSP